MNKLLRILVLIGLAGCNSNSSTGESRPNIVFILADDFDPDNNWWGSMVTND